MFKFRSKRASHKLFLYAYCLLCSFLVGCASTGGNYDLGKADAQIVSLEQRYPALSKDLTEIKANLSSASKAISEKEVTIDYLTKMLDTEQDKSKTRLLWIWKLTSAMLLLLIVVGAYLAWKLK